MSEEKFVALQKQVFKLFKNKNYDDVLSVINKAEDQFPERLDRTIFWKACVYSLLGRQENAVAVLEEGLKKGVWWNPIRLTRDQDLNSLHNLESFKTIVKRCGDILESSGQNSQAQLYTYGNCNAAIGIFSLHWRGSNVGDYAPYWFDNNRLKEYFYGFPQSSQIFGYNSYCWDDPEVSKEEISTTFAEYKKKGNTKQDILAGASQGGKLTIELSFTNPTPSMKGFIAVIPSIQDVASIEALLHTNTETEMRGCIITGDKDPYYKNTVELVKMFEAYSIPCKLIVIEGLGHDFPSDFPDLLTEAVDYILQAKNL
ncbi:DUF3089 domain-containing protein [Caldibacillus lycopersici]|uniref:DUF3089 domain-containing protein n=1 Tax=Perspicuibacillus lycopersici TaxID=1325689 RepID=A0AAE3IRL1_9BACI|nr:DUF3089 domain-containing protein [Perspicuibacillus lycopersici]MCU9613313.1 DUF3089 domain-containing protein [Perspicuibacillus lycopersici]